jgi:hypothetical protein
MAYGAVKSTLVQAARRVICRRLVDDPVNWMPRTFTFTNQSTRFFAKTPHRHMASELTMVLVTTN